MKEKKKYYENIENSFDLFNAAQDDIIQIYNTINSDKFNHEKRVGRICRYATESVEKMLKGFIINFNNKIKVYGIHDMLELYEKIVNIDSSFIKLKDNLNNLKNYTPKFRYGSSFKIEKHEVKECLKNLKLIYDYPLISELRNKINKEKKL